MTEKEKNHIVNLIINSVRIDTSSDLIVTLIECFRKIDKELLSATEILYDIEFGNLETISIMNVAKSVSIIEQKSFLDKTKILLAYEVISDYFNRSTISSQVPFFNPVEKGILVKINKEIYNKCFFCIEMT